MGVDCSFFEQTATCREAIGAAAEFLKATWVGCRVSSGRARVDEDRDGDGVPGQESEEDGPGPP